MSGTSGLRRHGHTSAGDGGGLTAPSLTTLVIPGASSPAQTAEGDAVWDTDDDKLTIGTGAARKTLVNTSDPLNTLAAATADISLGSHKLTNVTDPGSPQDAATKAYVDSEVAGAGGLSDQGTVTYLDYTVAAAPADPSAGYLRHYAKTGGHMAQRDSSGTETLLDSAGGSSDWDTIITKASDDSVDNDNVNFYDDSELTLAIAAGEVWRVVVELIYSGNDATADYRWKFATSGPSITGWHRYTIVNNGGNSINVSTGVQDVSVTATTAVTCGCDASDTPFVGYIEFMFYVVSSSGTLKFQISQAGTTSAGKISKTRIGTTLRAKQLV